MALKNNVSIGGWLWSWDYNFCVSNALVCIARVCVSLKEIQLGFLVYMYEVDVVFKVWFRLV